VKLRLGTAARRGESETRCESATAEKAPEMRPSNPGIPGVEIL
jgi:hypothetical protein